MLLSPGQIVLNRYVIEQQIGVGGMGEVYRAHHQTLAMPVAIKVMTGDSSPDLVQRFGREAQLLARVRHPNIVSILDVGQTDDGAPCMAMEFLEGEALDARLERKGVLAWNEVRAIGLAALKGLDAMHTAGIVHRDLKPANVFAVRGTPEVIKLVDFGIAYSTAADAAKFTRAGAVIGTPAYMSPEQLIGAALDARSDLYAIGLMLYELVTGHLPFGDESAGALRRLHERVPPPRAGANLPPIPEPIVAAILSALAIEPDRRPRSAKALYAALRGTRQADAGQTAATLNRPPPVPGAARPTAAAAEHAPSAPVGEVSTGHTQVPSAATQIAYGEEAPASQVAPGVRALVAAKLPVSRMSRDEQRALAQFAAPGRTYHMGGGMWFAIMPAADVESARAAARRLRDALAQRYGDTCKVVWAPASAAFALTPASLSGSAPLPDEINRLLERLTK
jgi:serine/threonine-protein kinase